MPATPIPPPPVSSGQHYDRGRPKRYGRTILRFLVTVVLVFLLEIVIITVILATGVARVALNRVDRRRDLPTKEAGRPVGGAGGTTVGGIITRMIKTFIIIGDFFQCICISTVGITLIFAYSLRNRQNPRGGSAYGHGTGGYGNGMGRGRGYRDSHFSSADYWSSVSVLGVL